MRNRVLDAVAAVGYEPDLLAQSLRTGATMSIGFVVGDISNPLMSEVALGAEVSLGKVGYSVLLTNSENDSALDASRIQLLRKRRVDGLLLSLTDETDPVVHEAISRLEVPAVLVDRVVPSVAIGGVLSDHADGMSRAANHLIGLGHTRIGLVNGNPNVRPSRERASALRQVCRSAGVTASIRTSAFTAEHGYRATISLLGDDDRPTALIAGGNQILVGVLRALRDLEMTIPDDVSLVTCDETPLSDFLQPAISTITRNTHEIGMVAADLLIAQLKGDPPSEVVLPTEFRETDSCSPPRARSRPRTSRRPSQ